MKSEDLAAIETACREIAEKASNGAGPCECRRAVELLSGFAKAKLRDRYVFDSTLADDIAQDFLVGLAAGTMIKTYEPGRGRLDGYLLMSVKNLCESTNRRIARERRILRRFKAGLERNDCEDHGAEKKELSELVRVALDQLPPDFQAVLRDFFYVGASQSVINSRTPRTLRAVRRRALKQLRSIMEKKMPAAEWRSLLA